MRRLLPERLRRILGSTAVSAVAFAMVLYGGISAVRAAPRIRSEYFGAQVELTDIETALTENGVIVEGEDQLLGYERFLKPNGLSEPVVEAIGNTGYHSSYVSDLAYGVAYDEAIGVRNVGTIDQHVRVTLRKYWVDQTGKRVNMDPALIEVGLVDDGEWVVDEEASTDERIVVYRTKILPVGEDSGPITDHILISSAVLTSMTDDVRDYDGATMRLEASVDAVQTHNADEAMRSVWGRSV